MYRRTLLANAAVGSGLALAGCAAFAETGTPERPWPASDPIDDPNGAHDLFVENHTERSEAAWLRLVRDDDAVIVAGRYELPDGRGIRFDDVAAWDRAYTVDLAMDGLGQRSLAWETPECGPGSETSDGHGSRNAAVRVEEGDGGLALTLRVDECDALKAGGLPTGAAESFRLNG